MIHGLPMYVDAATCTECGGSCCKNFPGILAPGDLGPEEGRAAAILSLLESGRYVADIRDSDGDITVYHLRPAQKGKEGRLLHDTSGPVFFLSISQHSGECTFLGPSGCELDAGARPYACRTLRPLPRAERTRLGRCEEAGRTEREQIEAWIAYSDAVEEAVDELRLRKSRVVAVDLGTMTVVETPETMTEHQ